MGAKEFSCFYSLGLSATSQSITGALFLRRSETLKLDFQAIECCSIALRWLLMIFQYFFKLLIFFYRKELRLQYSCFFLSRPSSQTLISKFFSFSKTFYLCKSAHFQLRCLSCSSALARCQVRFSSSMLTFSLIFYSLSIYFCKATPSSSNTLLMFRPCLLQQNWRVVCSSLIRSFFSAIYQANIQRLSFFFLLSIYCLLQFYSIWSYRTFFDHFRPYNSRVRAKQRREREFILSLPFVDGLWTKQVLLRGLLLTSNSTELTFLSVSAVSLSDTPFDIFFASHNIRVPSCTLLLIHRSKVCVNLNPR